MVSIADGDLVRRALEREVAAEDALYRRYARPVAGLITRLMGSQQETEDILHDSFVAAFEKLGQLRDPDAFRPWLMRIAVVRVRRCIRRRRLRRRLGLLPAPDDGSLERLASSRVSPEMRADLAIVDGVLQRLPADQRIAWMLRFVEGHRLTEVGAICGCSLATAKRRIAAAQRAMDGVLQVDAGEET